MKKILRNISLICLCLLLTGCFGKKKEETKKEEPKKTVVKSKNVIKDQTIDGIKISDVDLSVTDGASTYTAKVTNTTKKDIAVEDIDIIVKDKDGNQLVQLLGYVGGTIKPDDSKPITSSTDADLKKADSITYKINRK